MADRTCDKCGAVFAQPCRLKTHRARKTPCALIIQPPVAAAEHACKYCGRRFKQKTNMYRHIQQSCKVANSADGGAKQLADHAAAQENKTVIDLDAKLKTLTALVEQIAIAQLTTLQPQGVIQKADPCIQTNIQANIQANILTNVVNVVNVVPWDEEKGHHCIHITIEHVRAAFAENALLREFTKLNDYEMTDVTIAPPFITEILIDLIKRCHADLSTRNVYLNPKREDQVCVRTRSESWELREIDDAIGTICRGVTYALHRILMDSAKEQNLPMEIQNAISYTDMMFTDDPSLYIGLIKKVLKVHLTNMRIAILRQPTAVQK
jgi:hypothetical protein